MPVKALKEMATILGMIRKELTFFLINRQLYAAGSGIIYYTRLINAAISRYEQVIPESFDGEARFDRMTIVSALTREFTYR